MLDMGYGDIMGMIVQSVLGIWSDGTVAGYVELLNPHLPPVTISYPKIIQQDKPTPVHVKKNIFPMPDTIISLKAGLPLVDPFGGAKPRP